MQYMKSCNYRSNATSNVYIKHQNEIKFALCDINHGMVVGGLVWVFQSTMADLQGFLHTTVLKVYKHLCKKKKKEKKNEYQSV